MHSQLQQLLQLQPLMRQLPNQMQLLMHSQLQQLLQLQPLMRQLPNQMQILRKLPAKTRLLPVMQRKLKRKRPKRLKLKGRLQVPLMMQATMLI
ncbi:hypothetical protein WP50_35595 [Lactiplantibacillus plantarum]|nr:hypothetical protein WP50_35595 [Lactiplantibacillus plantarum]